MAITEFSGTVPSSTDTDNFDARADDAWAWLVAVVPEINTAVTAMNLNSVSTVSSSTHSAATGSKTFTVQSGKSFLDGMWVTIADDADPTKQMVAIVTSYSSTTLIVNVQWHSGFGGSLSDWIIVQCPPHETNRIQDEIFVVTPNGCGSTNTLARRYTTIVTNNGGSSMMWSDSATLGGYLTVNQAGLYVFTVKDMGAGSQATLTRNATTYSTTATATLSYGRGASNTDCSTFSASVYCAASDVIRVILQTTSVITSGDCFFRAKRFL